MFSLFSLSMSRCLDVSLSFCLFVLSLSLSLDVSLFLSWCSLCSPLQVQIVSESHRLRVLELPRSQYHLIAGSGLPTVSKLYEIFATFPLAWPDFIVSMFELQGVVSTVGSFLLNPECELKMSVVDIFYSRMIGECVYEGARERTTCCLVFILPS